MIVYKTTCLLNGKFYVGQDANDSPAYLGSGLHLRRAIKKYGRASFRKEVLERCDTKQQLDEAEKLWIDELDAINIGYNIAEGGTGGKTRPDPWNKGLTKHTDARVRRNGQATSRALMGHTQSQESRTKRSNSLRGKRQSSETIAKRAESLRGRQLSEATKQKISRTLKKRNPNAWVELTCAKCGSLFSRRRSREDQRQKNGRDGPYCGRSCSTAATKGPSPHGSTYRYRRLGCRCDLCREAVRLDARRYRKRKRESREQV